MESANWLTFLGVIFAGAVGSFITAIVQRSKNTAESNIAWSGDARAWVTQMAERADRAEKKADKAEERLDEVELKLSLFFAYTIDLQTALLQSGSAVPPPPQELIPPLRAHHT